MALGTNRVSAVSAPGMAAAATSRVASGGRNVASVRTPIEETGFSSQIGVNDNALFRYEDEIDLAFQDRQEERRRQYTPLMSSRANGFKVDEVAERMGTDGGGVFLNEVLRGVGLYERTLSVTTPGTVKRGSVLNYMY